MRTQISVPYSITHKVGQVLCDAGFVVGSSGGGTVEFERSGETSPEEQGKLVDLMADAVFRFDIYDETEDIEDNDV